MATLTPNQLRVVEIIRSFTASRGYSPTLDEIAARLGVIKPTVQQYLRALEEKGVIRRKRYSHRSIEIVEPRNRGGSGDPPRQRRAPSREALPLVGRIAAGKPIEAVETHEEVDLAELLRIAPGRETFLLRVKGDSMIGDGILDGDYVVVEKRATASDGETVVALLPDGLATLKRFYREKGRVRLQPANPKMKPMRFKDVTVQGVVRGVVRMVR